MSLLTIQLGLSLISFPIYFPSTEISFLQPWRLEGWDLRWSRGSNGRTSLVISLFQLHNVFVYPAQPSPAQLGTMQCLHLTFPGLTQGRARASPLLQTDIAQISSAPTGGTKYLLTSLRQIFSTALWRHISSVTELKETFCPNHWQDRLLCVGTPTLHPREREGGGGS